MAKRFPKFQSHDEASCFNCGGDFGTDGYYFASGHAAGHGAFAQSCSKCGMSTWYDVERPAFVLEATGTDHFRLHLTN